MQSDDVIWSVINTQFCSYKVKYARSLPDLAQVFDRSLELPRRIFVGTSTTSQDSVADNHVRSPTRDTQPYVNTKVRRCPGPVSRSIRTHRCPRCTLPLCQDDRTRTHTCQNVGKDPTFQKLLESTRAGEPTMRCRVFQKIRPPMIRQIDKELMYWPNFTIHKCKQRVTKITQYLIKMRRIKLRQECVLLVYVSWSGTN